jgi:hypothetical protein
VTCAAAGSLAVAFVVLCCLGKAPSAAQERSDALGCRRDEVVLAKKDAADDATAGDEEQTKPTPVPVLTCTMPGKGGTSVRLQIRTLKLNEIAISALIHDWPLEIVRDQIGRAADVWENEVFDHARSLNARFGQTDAELGSGANSLRAVNSVGVDDRYAGGEEVIKPFRLLMGDGAINGGIENIRYEIALPAEFDRIASTDMWPDGWSFYYGDAPLVFGNRSRLPSDRAEHLWFVKRQGMEKTRLWRYLTTADFDAYKENFFAMDHRVRSAYTMSVFDRAGQVEKSASARWPLYLDAIREFTVGEFPDDFLFAYGAFYRNEHDIDWEFLFPPRRVNLEVDIVENISATGVDILQIGLAKTRDQNLRKATRDEVWAKPAARAKAGDQSWRLPPGGRLAIPKRILLEYDQAIVQAFNDDAAADRIYGKIRELPPGAAMELHNTADWVDLLKAAPVRKKADSFAAPSRPNFDPYVDGPSLRLAFIETATARLKVQDAVAPQAVGFTAHTESGQCPVLEVYDEESKTYEPFGKVLVSSNWDYSARDQVIAFDKPQLRFRLVERELEVTHLDQATLAAILKDGRRIELDADVGHLVHRDDRHVVLFNGEAIDFGFSLPASVSIDQVQSTTLTLRGHYQRYGKLLLTTSSK